MKGVRGQGALSIPPGPSPHNHAAQAGGSPAPPCPLGCIKPFASVSPDQKVLSVVTWLPLKAMAFSVSYVVRSTDPKIPRWVPAAAWDPQGMRGCGVVMRTQLKRQLPPNWDRPQAPEQECKAGRAEEARRSCPHQDLPLFRRRPWCFPTPTADHQAEGSMLLPPYPLRLFSFLPSSSKAQTDGTRVGPDTPALDLRHREPWILSRSSLVCSLHCLYNLLLSFTCHCG